MQSLSTTIKRAIKRAIDPTTKQAIKRLSNPIRNSISNQTMPLSNLIQNAIKKPNKIQDLSANPIRSALLILYANLLQSTNPSQKSLTNKPL